MKRRVVMLALALLGAACDEAPVIDAADVAIAIEVAGAAEALEVGEAFTIDVTRSWNKRLAPVEWDDAALAPLVLRRDSRDEVESESHRRETLRFHAVAFEPGSLTIAPIVFAARPRSGGAAVTATADGFGIDVVSALGPGDDGVAEFPGGPYPPRRPSWPWLVVPAVLLLGAGLTLRRKPRRNAQPVREVDPAAAPADPASRALERLSSLIDEGDPVALHVAIDEVLREYVAARYGVPSEYMTSRDLLAAERLAAGADERSREALRRALLACDLVKFADRVPSRDSCVRTRESAGEFVEGTRSR